MFDQKLTKVGSAVCQSELTVPDRRSWSWISQRHCPWGSRPPLSWCSPVVYQNKSLCVIGWDQRCGCHGYAWTADGGLDNRTGGLQTTRPHWWPQRNLNAHNAAKGGGGGVISQSWGRHSPEPVVGPDQLLQESLPPVRVRQQRLQSPPERRCGLPVQQAQFWKHRGAGRNQIINLEPKMDSSFCLVPIMPHLLGF